MTSRHLVTEDLDQLESLGIAAGEAERQLALFREPPPPASTGRGPEVEETTLAGGGVKEPAESSSIVPVE